MANCKFEKQQYRYSNDNGVTWYNVVPERIEAGNLIEYDSVDCSIIDTLYKWTLLEGEYICEDNVKYKKEIRYDSYDGGSTWYVSYPLVYRAGERVGIDEEFCSFKYEGHYNFFDDSDSCPPYYKWNGARCVYVDPLKVVKCNGKTVLSSGDTKYYADGYKVASAEIGDCVTSIGDNAFRYCNRLTSVTIPDSVTSIGYHAFGNCSSLTSITIPDSVTTIGDYAFSGCTSLTSVTIPDSVTSIGYEAFYNCYSLTSVTIGGGVTSIGDYAFYYCYSLTSVTIGNSVVNIGQYAFYYCYSLTSVTIGSGVTSIGDYAFASCSGLTSITIPSGVTSIGDNAFEYCSGLTNITIPDSVTSINNYTFYGCISLTSIDIPDSVTSINNMAFAGCNSLTSITINSTTPPTLGTGAFDYTNNCPIYVPCESVDAYKTASGWSTYASRIREIPETCSKIKATYSNGQTYSAACDSSTELLTGQTKPSGYEYSAMTSAVIGNCVTSIGNNAFYGCSGLTSVTIGSGVTSIGGNAFGYCSRLTSITIPDSVTSIDNYAFYGCSGLTSVTIGNSVTSIGYHAFDNCRSLTSITVNATTPPTLGANAFNNTNNCPIYVPSASVDVYKSASGWGIYADRIQAIPNS